MTMRTTRFFLGTISTSFFLFSSQLTAMSSWLKNDPYPVFSSVEPNDWLLTKKKVSFKNPDESTKMKDRLFLSVSPFSQIAYRGRDIDGNKMLGGTTTTSNNYDIELSDLEGRPNLLTLLYGDLPAGETLSPTLQIARNQIFPGLVGPINDTTLIDPFQLFGCISIPQKYTKQGARFALFCNIKAGFGVGIQTGYVSVNQRITGMIRNHNECDPSTACGFTPNTTVQNGVNTYLFEPLQTIANEIGYNLSNFNRHGWEELRLSIFWREAYELNKQYHDWPQVLFIPFFIVTGSIAVGREIDLTPTTPFLAAPIGNDGHNAIGFSTGINFDFIETVEVGIEGGITHFFSRDIENMHIPTSVYQTGIFPFRTDITLDPGMNWHFCAKLSAYHFLEKLSGHFQYVILEHKRNEISLRKGDPAFHPEVLEQRSGWKVQLANLGFTYDITPNAGFGFLWQAPLAQKNAYRSSTILLSVYGTF